MAITAFILDPTTLAELTALTTAAVALTTGKRDWWIVFFFYLVLTLAVEATGFYLRSLNTKPYALFAGFMVIQASFYAWLFHHWVTARPLRRFILWGFALYLLAFLYDLRLGNFTTYNTVSRITLSVYIVLLSCIYYRQLLRDDEMLQPLMQPSFWIVTGLFFFYFVTAALFCLRQQLLKQPDHGQHIARTLIGAQNWILYPSWSIAFICRKRKHLSSRP